MSRTPHHGGVQAVVNPHRRNVRESTLGAVMDAYITQQGVCIMRRRRIRQRRNVTTGHRSPPLLTHHDPRRTSGHIHGAPVATSTLPQTTHHALNVIPHGAKSWA
jgi:hypothetical protein